MVSNPGDRKEKTSPAAAASPSPSEPAPASQAWLKPAGSLRRSLLSSDMCFVPLLPAMQKLLRRRRFRLVLSRSNFTPALRHGIAGRHRRLCRREENHVAFVAHELARRGYFRAEMMRFAVGDDEFGNIGFAVKTAQPMRRHQLKPWGCVFA